MVGIPLVFDLVADLGPDARVVPPLVHELERHRQPARRQGRSGSKNYENLFTAYPFFWPALSHNLIWLAWLMFIATPLGMLLRRPAGPGRSAGRASTRACSTSRSSSRSRSSGSSGSLQYAPEQGLINNVLGRTSQRQPDRLAGRPEPQHLGCAGRRELAARRLHHGALPRGAEGIRPDAARGGQGRWRERTPDVLPRRLPGDDADQRRHRGHHHRSRLSAPSTSPTSSTTARTGSSCSRRSSRTTASASRTASGSASAIAVVLLVISLVPIVAFLTRMMREDRR